MRKSLMTGLVAAVLSPGLILTVSASSRADAPAIAAAKPYLGTAIGPMEQRDQPGAVVHEVTPASPAAKAGLKDGDIILKVDGKDVKNAEALVGMIAAHKPGDSLKLHIRRDGKEKDLNAVLAERPAPKKVNKPFKTGAFLGVWTRSMTEELKEKLGVATDKGAVVMQVMPESPAAKAGMARNDVITAVNDQTVNTPEELRTAVQKVGAGKEATLKFLHGKETKEAKVKLENGPMGFGNFRDFEEHFPKLFERFNGELPANLPPELKQRFEEFQKRLRDREEKPAVPAK